LNLAVFVQKSFRNIQMTIFTPVSHDFTASQAVVAHRNWLGPAPILALAIIATLALVAMNFWFSSFELRNDNDAILRLVEVRDLLGGQGWFDKQQYRMGLAGGFEMHWSRLIDAPIAGLILVAKMFGASTKRAENFAIFMWPVLLSFVTLLAALRIAHAKGGLSAAVFTSIVAVPTFQLLGQFANGQIDHHNAQTALSLTFIAALVAVRPSITSGSICGLCLALMSGIGIETQVHMVLGALAVTLLFLYNSQHYSCLVSGFGLSFALGNLVIFFGTISPADYSHATCDTFSIAQAMPSIIGGLGLSAAAFFSGDDSNFVKRFLLLSIVGMVNIAAAWPTSLPCVGNPLAGIDPLVQKFWLAHIKEAVPFLTVLKDDFSIALAYLMPIVVGLILACYFALKKANLRLTAIIIGGAVLTSLLISLFQFRTIIMGTHMVLPLLGIAAALVFKWADQAGKNLLHRVAMVGFVLGCFGHSWVVADVLIGEPLENNTAKEASTKNEKACSGPDFIAMLNAIPATTLMAVSNLGPDILIDTPHRVLAGPYHRNIEGLKASINAHILPPDQARLAMTKSGATHYVWCKGANEVSYLSKENGFAADMLAGKVPAWLEQVSAAPNGDYAVYRIKG
jgi:hypothetical protein